MEITHERIFDFKNHEYIPAHHDPKEPGYYMTIRCGLSGIYTHLDEWKDNKWQVGILDDSKVIAWTQEQITDQQVRDWCNALREKVNKKYKKS